MRGDMWLMAAVQSIGCGAQERPLAPRQALTGWVVRQGPSDGPSYRPTHHIGICYPSGVLATRETTA